MIESSSDLAGFFDIDEFGVAATYNGGSTVNGIFENEYFDGLDGAGIPIETSQPRFSCATSDVSGASHGDTLLISGTTYNVVGVQPDGSSVTVFLLEEA
jgi:hypothetical protein